jgi:DNA-binding transcriptional regulator YhcF (GntR family)
MIDIQHDSPVPIHEQIIAQLMAHVATGNLNAGARLEEYRAFAQRLLTNPQVVARAYAELEADGVLKSHKSGGMEICAGAAVICRVRLQDDAMRRLRQAIAQAFSVGLAESEIRQAVDGELAVPPASPLSAAEALNAIKKSHARSHRDSQGIQDLSRKKGAGPSEPDRAAGGDIRPARG